MSEPGGVPGEGLYRLLLRLHPPDFRQRYERDLVEYFHDAWRDEARGRGVWAHATFWIRTVWGTARTASGQWLAGRGGQMESWLQDLGYARRSLGKRPGFVAVVVLTLALGMGANSAVFSVFHSVLLAPLPYEEPNELVRIYRAERAEPDELQYLPGPVIADLRQNAESFEGVGILYNYHAEGVDLTDGDRPERVRLLRVGAGYFEVLRVQPVLGRTFRRDEERAGAGVVMVSERIWRRYLGGAPDAVGTRLAVDGEPRTVVGVVPDGFRDPLEGSVDVWMPQDLADPDLNTWGNHYLSAVARLGPDVTLDRARAEADALARRQAELQEDAGRYLFRLIPLREDVVGEAEPMLLALMGAVGFLLLVACVNVAGLFLARGASREHELAIRAALGSGRGRLVRQLLLESTLLALLGGAAGLVLGLGVLETLEAVAPPALPRREALGMGAEAVAVSSVVAVLVGIALGVVPAWQFTRPGTEAALSRAGRGGGERPARRRLRSGLVVAEVGLALVLLVAAGVLLKSFAALQGADRAIDARGVLTFEVNLPSARYAEGAERARFHRALHERLRGLPGVTAAGAVSRLPVTGNYHSWGVFVVEGPDGTPDFDEGIGGNQRVVEGDYFEALDITLSRGRSFGPEDRADAPRRAVVNEALVRRLFGDRDPVGRYVWVAGQALEVIGVVEDVPIGARGRVVPKVYHSHTQFADNRNWSMTQVVRVEGGMSRFFEAARRELAGLDPALVLHEPGTMAEVVGRGVADERFASLLMAAFAVVALLLTAVGMYGMLSYTVGRRTREIGVRMALGASAHRVRGMVVRQGMVLAILGVGIGLLMALGLMRILGSLLYRVSPSDPLVFSLVPAVLLAVAATASFLPALRATRVNPVDAFREE